MLQEVVFGWPFDEYERQAYSVQAHRVLEAVGLTHIPVQTPLQQLSGGYKRRVALAVQLVRRPAVSNAMPPSDCCCSSTCSSTYPLFQLLNAPIELCVLDYRADMPKSHKLVERTLLFTQHVKKAIECPGSSQSSSAHVDMF